MRWLRFASSLVLYFDNCLKQNKKFIELAKKIALNLSKAQPQKTIDILVEELVQVSAPENSKPRALSRASTLPIKHVEKKANLKFTTSSFQTLPALNKQKKGIWNLNELLPVTEFTGESLPFSTSNVALILLSEVVLDKEREFAKHLPRILHFSFLVADGNNSIVGAHAKALISNVFFSISLKHIKGFLSVRGCLHDI